MVVLIAGQDELTRILMIMRFALLAGILAAAQGIAWPQSACDVNKDGVVNIVDSQIAANNVVSCPTPAFQAFYSQVVTSIFGPCQPVTGLHTVALNWTASTTSGVTYNVYRATTSGGYNYGAPLATGISATSFTDCAVALGQAYFYVIRAVDGSGNQSVNSSEVSVTIPPT